MAATKPLTPNEARVLTERYNSLQGLKQIPWGLVCIVLPLITGSLLVGQTYATFLWIGIPVLLLAPVLHIAASSYYRRRFGQVMPRRDELNAWKIAGIGAVFLALIFGTGWIATSGLEQAVPFSVSKVLFWGLLLGLARMKVPHLPHYQAMCALGLALALAPLELLAVVATHPFSLGAGNAIGLQIFGVFLIIGGVLDHRILVRHLGDRGNIKAST